MQAALKSEKIDPVSTTLPTVTYDVDHKEIHAYVIVLPPQNLGGELKLRTPLIAIPGPVSPEEHSTWTVVWHLVNGGAAGKFVEGYGITIPSTTNPPPPPKKNFPDNVSVVRSGIDPTRPDTSDTWISVILNKVGDANCFRYDIVVDPADSNLAAKRAIRHDPTIAVTKDPLEPPPPPRGGGY